MSTLFNTCHLVKVDLSYVTLIGPIEPTGLRADSTDDVTHARTDIPSVTEGSNNGEQETASDGMQQEGVL